MTKTEDKDTASANASAPTSASDDRANKAKAAAKAEADRKSAADAADKAETEAIVTRRKAEDDARAEAKKADEQAEADRQARLAAGVDKYIGFSSGGAVSYVDHPDPANPRSRTVMYGGEQYEAVAVDADGVWLYRLPKEKP